MPIFIKIIQAVKSSISPARLNFRRRPILCTSLYRNRRLKKPLRGLNVSHQLPVFVWYSESYLETSCKRAPSVAHLTNFSFEFVFETFMITEDASQRLLYHGAKKSKWPKTQIKGGSCLNSVFNPPPVEDWPLFRVDPYSWFYSNPNTKTVCTESYSLFSRTIFRRVVEFPAATPKAFCTEYNPTSDHLCTISTSHCRSVTYNHVHKPVRASMERLLYTQVRLWSKRTTGVYFEKWPPLRVQLLYDLAIVFLKFATVQLQI